MRMVVSRCQKCGEDMLIPVEPFLKTLCKRCEQAHLLECVALATAVKRDVEHEEAVSASIYYQPVKGKVLPMGGPSSFLDLLRRIMSSGGPWELDGYWTMQLTGAAHATENSEHRAALEEIVEAIDKHGTIRVWAEY